jgi:hypothetical protein
MSESKNSVAVSRPWWVGIRSEYGYELLARFNSFAKAHNFAYSYPKSHLSDVTVAHVDGGAELWEYERRLTRSLEELAIETQRLRPDPSKIELMKGLVSEIYAEVFELTESRGWEVTPIQEGRLMKLRLTKPQEANDMAWPENSFKEVA